MREQAVFSSALKAAEATIFDRSQSGGRAVRQTVYEYSYQYLVIKTTHSSTRWWGVRTTLSPREGLASETRPVRL